MYCDQPPNRPSVAGIRDAVDAPGRTTRRRAVNGARAAAPQVRCTSKNTARSPSRSAIRRAPQRATDRFEHAGGHVAGNDRIRNAGESAVPEVHVGAADFRPRGAEKEAPGGRSGRGTRGSRSVVAATSSPPQGFQSSPELHCRFCDAPIHDTGRGLHGSRMRPILVGDADREKARGSRRRPKSGRGNPQRSA